MRTSPSICLSPISAKRVDLKIADPRLLTSIQLSLKTWPPLRKLFNFCPQLSMPHSLWHWWGGASPSINCCYLLHVLRYLPLCFVAINTT